MNYLLIKKGYVVKGSTIITEDILVGGSKILQMGINLERPTSDTPVIDATGKYILPGAIDIDRHFLDLVHDTPNESELRRLNQAQIFNGTTTMIDVVEDCYQKNYIYNIFKAKEKSRANLLDYGFHLTFSELKKYAADALDYSYMHEGVSTFFVNISSLDEVGLRVLEGVFEHASSYNLLVMCDLNLPESGRSDLEKVSLRDPINLKHHFSTLTKLVELGLKYKSPLLFLNVKFQEELDLIDDGIDKGGEFFASLRLWFNLGDYNQVEFNEQQSLSGIAKEHNLNQIFETEIWSLVKSPRFLISSPLYNLTFEEDSQDELVYNRPDAYFYIRNYLSLLYTVGVLQKKISMLELVDIVSARPSKLMGLWPKKGVLQSGADADIVIWNPTFDRNLYCALPNVKKESDKSIKLEGRTDFVFIKGKMVYNGENFYPHTYDGDFVFRSAKIY